MERGMRDLYIANGDEIDISPGESYLISKGTPMRCGLLYCCVGEEFTPFLTISVHPADIGWLTGNGNKLSNSQACWLAQLCLAAA